MYKRIADLTHERDELQRKHDDLIITSATVISEIQGKVGALAVENSNFKHAMSVTIEHVSVMDTGQAGVAAMIINDALHNSETPATEAAIAEIEARGVDKFAARVRKYANDEDSCNRKCSLNLTAERAENYSSWMRKESGQ